MSPTSRSVLYSLLTVVLILLLGIVTILSVAYQRNRRLEDQRTDLQRRSFRQENQIKDLKVRLEDCDTVQNNSPANGLQYIPSFPELDTGLDPMDDPAYDPRLVR